MRSSSAVQWKAYPALLVAGALAAGIGVAAWRVEIGFAAWVSVAAVGAALFWSMALWERRRLVTLAPLLRTAAVGVVVAAAGAALWSYHQLAPADHIARHVPPPAADGRAPDVTVVGRVSGAPERRAGRIRFVLEAERLAGQQGALPVRGRVQTALLPSMWEPEAQPFPHLEEGDVVRITGRLEALRPPRNPADFDYGGYLRQRGIYATLSTYEPEDVAVLGTARGPLREGVTRARRHVDRQIERYVPSPAARGVLRALILADRSGIATATRERFIRTGLMHLLAVSGLHVLLVGMVLYGLLRPLLTRLRMRRATVEVTRAAFTVLVLGAYMLLTGARPSVVRAVVMATLFIGGEVMQRSSHPLNTLGVAAVALLVFNPAHLFDVGFQLSFAAVAAIVTLGSVLRGAVTRRWSEHGWRSFVTASVVTSVAAVLGTAPVLLYHFGHVALGGLVLNVVAIPLTALGLAAGLLTVLLGGWFGAAAVLFGAAAGAFLQMLLFVAEAGSAMAGWAAVRVHVKSAWALLAMGTALAMLAQWPRPRLRWRLAIATLAFVNAGLWIGLWQGAHAPRLDVVFFDVGQGDAALVSLPNGKHALIDAGGRTPFTDEATRTLVPHLERFGIRRLDAVVISHTDSDHLGGLPTLLRTVPVGRMVHNGRDASSALYAEVRHLLDSLQVPHRAVHAGDALRLDSSVQMQILAPDPELLTAAVSDNDASVVLRLTYGGTRFLFTGDVERTAEAQLLSRFAPLLASEVVKVSHHGSRTSSTPAFVEQATADASAPARAVVSVARRNAFGLPSAEVLGRWTASGSVVSTTAAEGAVWLRSDGKRVTRVQWR